MSVNCNDIPPCNKCNDCPTCGCCTEDCTCTPPGYINDGCTETVSSDCVIYNGILPCIPIQKGNTITVVIQRIATYLKNLFNHVHSSSLVIAPSGGSCNGDVDINIVPSSDANNIFTLGTDGYPYVPAPEIAVIDVNIVNGECITWDKTVVGNVITFTPTIDWTCVASHTCAVSCETLCPNPLNLTVN